MFSTRGTPPEERSSDRAHLICHEAFNRRIIHEEEVSWSASCARRSGAIVSCQQRSRSISQTCTKGSRPHTDGRRPAHSLFRSCRSRCLGKLATTTERRQASPPGGATIPHTEVFFQRRFFKNASGSHSHARSTHSYNPPSNCSERLGCKFACPNTATEEFRRI